MSFFASSFLEKGRGDTTTKTKHQCAAMDAVKKQAKSKGKKKNNKKAALKKSKVAVIEDDVKGEGGDDYVATTKASQSPTAVKAKAAVDPWKGFKSPFGGKLSPVEEWNKICAEKSSCTSKSLDLIKSDFGTSCEAIDKAVDCAIDRHNASSCEGSGDNTATASANDPKAVADGDENDGAASTAENDGVDSAAAATAAVDIDMTTQDVTEVTEDTAATKTAPKVERASIDTLRIFGCDLPCFEISAEFLPQLVTLEIVGSSVTGEAIEKNLTPKSNFLRVLNLAANDIKEVPAKALANTPKLLSLNLSHNPLHLGSEASINDKAFSSLAMTLFSLDLESCGLVKVADALKPLLNLRVLNLSSNNLAFGELGKLADVGFVKKLEELTILPNENLQADAGFGLTMVEILKKMTCLKVLNASPFSQSVAVDVQKLASLQLHAADDNNTKDSSTCSCVWGNPCTNKYNCMPHIWHRRYEIAKMAQDDPNFDREKALMGDL